MTGKTRTDFVLEAVRRADPDALSERTRLVIDAETCARFAAALDAPWRPDAKLRRTMATLAPWEDQ